MSDYDRWKCRSPDDERAEEFEPYDDDGREAWEDEQANLEEVSMASDQNSAALNVGHHAMNDRPNHSYYAKLLPDGRYECGLVQYNWDNRKKDVSVPIITVSTYFEARRYLASKQSA